MKYIKIRGARVHNLKNIDLDIPRDQLVVLTGLSGSGKSSLAFDTIYAEGQRRYVESLSAYARQFLEKLDKPDVDSIEGLSPAISIDQKASSHNPRSTVGTVTEIYDYLRILFATVGTPQCLSCGLPIQGQSLQEIINQIQGFPLGTSVTILAPKVSEKKGNHRQVLEAIQQAGFARVRVNGEIFRLNDVPELAKTKSHTIEIVVDRMAIDPDNASRLAESVETGLRHGDGRVMVWNGTDDVVHLFSEWMACPTCNVSFPEINSRLFSFNAPAGACPTCNGLGEQLEFDPELVIEDPELPAYLATRRCLNLDGTYYGRAAARSAKKYGFSMVTRFSELAKSHQNVVLYGDPIGPTDDWQKYGHSGPGWEGVITNLRRRYLNTPSEMMRAHFRQFMSSQACKDCGGHRLNPMALAIKIKGLSISDFTGLTVSQAREWIGSIELTDKQRHIVKQVVKEISSRLLFLETVGIGYLNLNRIAGTLSGGEFQRIRLATQIGSALMGVLYVLDEPSIGLHQRDNERLIETLKQLRDLGNTVVVVEHDEDTIHAADHVIDVGPGAGRHGGEIVFSGTPTQLIKNTTSITGKYLSGTLQIPIPLTRRNPDAGEVVIKGASENNLKSIDVAIPLKRLVAVTGVSGSGKSTLINDILHQALMRHFYKSNTKIGKHTSIEGLSHLDKIITIDQSPIGRTPRSNPATYTGAFTPIRELFAATREAKMKGYTPGRFSFNVRGGRCETCSGDGVLKIEMHFLSDVYVTCDVCKGLRYNHETLTVKFKGHSIADVLNMTVSESLELFSNIPAIASKLETLESVGLGYVHVGQNATTLSGGEAQRIKLAKELSKRSTGRTLYLLDEPTTGLHFADVARLLDVLNRLVEAGNTVVVIEHNLDVIKTADYVIDLGPEGGNGGGGVVAAGTPEAISAVKASYTGQYLKHILKKWGRKADGQN